MGDGLAFSPPGLPVRRGVTSGCVKSVRVAPGISAVLPVLAGDGVNIGLPLFEVNRYAFIFCGSWNLQTDFVKPQGGRQVMAEKKPGEGRVLCSALCQRLGARLTVDHQKTRPSILTSW